ncbi:MAG: hypothetical protein PHH40_00875 [Candidatus Moranbacteria bacterium]|nr:hypothetical protein [Candidatus Moranbacteria bacterium]MDD3964867.1 hypothetical protein [Candidatus Moranbacteria bacterium]
MAQTFYIESDEEIISVISHLRKSLDEENIFVFPKRALVLQSIINLRLLEREAIKCNKKIIIVTQDEAGKMLAEKAGIETQDYLEESLKKETHIEFSSRNSEAADISREQYGTSFSDDEEESHSLISADTIGSTAFNMKKEPNLASKNIAVAPFSSFASNTSSPVEKKISIRNASPEKLTSLNSKRTDMSAPRVSVRPTLLQPMRTALVDNTKKPLSPTMRTTQEEQFPAQTREYGERLKNFYTHTDTNPQPQRKQDTKEKIQSATVNKNARVFFFALGGISLLSVVFVGLFFLFPKADVHVTPFKDLQSFEKEFNGKLGDDARNDIAIRMIENEQEVSVTVATTGKSGGTDQKSHGTVTLYNAFSTEPQSLVATTRLETPDGKIFRLESGITLPGMKEIDGKQVPGEITVEVTADRAGEEYNIEASRFSVPGFKGSPKYEKFSAQSSKAMTGGGKSGISDVSVVTKLDQDTALREASTKAKEMFLNDTRGEIDASEKILQEQIETTPTFTPVFPSVGTVANMIEYKGVFKVKAIVFSEKTVQQKIEDIVVQNNENVKYRVASSNITYDDSLVDFTIGTVRIKASARVTKESVIDIEKLRSMLAGKDMPSIEQSLKDFPELKSIRITFYPKWFVSHIPKSEEKISLTVDPAENR